MRPRTKRDYKNALDDIYNAFQEHGTLGAGAFSDSPIHREVLCELKKRGAVCFSGRTRSLKMWWNPQAIRPGNTAAESIMNEILERERMKSQRKRNKQKPERKERSIEQPSAKDISLYTDEELIYEFMRRGFLELTFKEGNDGDITVTVIKGKTYKLNL